MVEIFIETHSVARTRDHKNTQVYSVIVMTHVMVVGR